MMEALSCRVESLSREKRISIFFWASMFAALLILSIIAFASQQQHSKDGNYAMEKSPKGVNELKNSPSSSSSSSFSHPHRKLLVVDELHREETNRIWGDKCSRSDVVISQGPTEPLANGIPTYTVEVMNVCVTGCDISGIHLSCGWFSSARLINPRVFKRLRFDDCLVNDGKPLVNGRTISFQYANTFRYPLSVSAVIC